jgi:hypothetical protein
MMGKYDYLQVTLLLGGGSIEKCLSLSSETPAVFSYSSNYSIKVYYSINNLFQDMTLAALFI